MDSSYPYSRRLVSRARLHKCLAALAAAGLAGAAALFLLTWKPDTLSAAPSQAAAPLLALSSSALDGQVRGPRRIYPYSVVPGGVAGPTELARVIRTDRVVAAHYASFDVAKARPVVVEKPRAVHVSYRKNGKVYWTARKVMLAEGETLLSDGRNEMRARCANRISEVPQYPVEAHQPAMEELDEPVELEEGQGYALGPDGLPVSMDAEDGISRHTGQRFAIHSGGAGNGAAPASAPADTLLAGSSVAPATAGASPLTSTNLSSLASSIGSRPTPAGSTPAASAPAAGTGSGSAGGSSASPSGASAAPLPSAGPDTPAGAPLLEEAVAPAPTVKPPSAEPTPKPLPAPAPMPIPLPTPVPAPSPTPVPAPSPTPGTEPGPVLPPLPGLQPGGQQSGGGGSDKLPPTLPGTGPLLPQPGTDIGVFVPDPGKTPPLESGNSGSGSPADVPEPGSTWLAGAGIAALYALRRRRPRPLGRA